MANEFYDLSADKDSFKDPMRPRAGQEVSRVGSRPQLVSWLAGQYLVPWRQPLSLWVLGLCGSAKVLGFWAPLPHSSPTRLGSLTRSTQAWFGEERG